MTDPDPREAVEGTIRASCEAGDLQRGATLIMESYGTEIFRFLCSRLRDGDAASEVFSQFTENLWRGLAGFRWQCSARVWAYTVARHTAARYLEETRRRRGRDVPLSRVGPMSELEEKIRTATIQAMRTEAKSRIALLREQLPVDDQTLLILRVNRQLNWKEIAQVMVYEGETVADSALDKEAVRLRKRFQLVKDKLRQMALEQGLVEPEGEG